jgi:ribosome recycling factor
MYSNPDSIAPKLTCNSIRTASLCQALPRAQPLKLQRNFSQSPLLCKKKGKADREKEEALSEASGEAEDPFDFSTLEYGIEKTIEKLKNDLSKLRTGGRFNPEILENVRVHLNKESKASERLGDLAQVLPKGGRSVMVLVGEKDVSISLM